MIRLVSFLQFAKKKLKSAEDFRSLGLKVHVHNSLRSEAWTEFDWDFHLAIPLTSLIDESRQSLLEVLVRFELGLDRFLTREKFFEFDLRW
jgi:hypothetical protein